ncbi:4Fe-4S dicluster domain-containing protein [Calderihabitans maritimus]|uniref:4Fe-4S ferredoxin n=1 Tax=Calderihabitans maritimus TaxID=1246530 RepID=A0A1Z5HXK3_9FIRM|nr:4Fe-4S dicluster domain-containing protein [Calderihabitans maritimus]GAW94045.1 4Fe-4S ferredoxin [Calderihabitans maritimus]
MPQEEERLSRRKLFGLVKDKLVGAGSAALQVAAPKLASGLLRPPGAVEEEEFLATCRRCGKCIEACPGGALREAGPEHGLALGTPYLVPGEVPCSLCLTCQQVCPSGAIQSLARDKVRIAVAVIKRDRCLAWQGGMCRACYDRCPDRGRAMVLESFRRPVIRESDCSGCGNCAHACVLKPAAIVMKPVEKRG